MANSGPGTESLWGSAATEYFYSLTPDRILGAVEAASGLRCTGRVMALNSFENRVYEVELELDEKPKDPADRFLIAKFYRPGRWSPAQIREEHQFLAELAEMEIPVVAARPLAGGDTICRLPDTDLWYALFPKAGGRSPDELTDEQLAQVGRMLARLHAVGATKPAAHRLALTAASYGTANLRYLIDAKLLPEELKSSYQRTVEDIVQRLEPALAATASHRIHGDCHLGNLVMGRQGLFFVDFDDMVTGPAVQDLWLMVPGRDHEAERQMALLLDGYESMRAFDHRSLRLIEGLRALRLVHFASWIGRRWQDPAFPLAFPHYGTSKYWSEQLQDLREQQQLISELL